MTVRFVFIERNVTKIAIYFDNEPRKKASEAFLKNFNQILV